MYTSNALKKSVAAKANQLLLTIAKGFHRDDEALVIHAYTTLSPDGRKIGKHELAQHLSLPENCIEYLMHKFVNTYQFFRHDDVTESEPHISFQVGTNQTLGPELGKQELIDIFEYENITEIDDEVVTRDKLKEFNIPWLLEQLHDRGLVSRMQWTKGEIKGEQSGPSNPLYTRNRSEIWVQVYEYKRNNQVYLRVKVDKERSHWIRKSYYRIDPESMVNRVRYTVLNMQIYYDKYSDSSQFYCPNEKCKHHTEFIPQSVIMQRETTQLMSGGLSGLNNHAYNTMVKLPPAQPLIAGGYGNNGNGQRGMMPNNNNSNMNNPAAFLGAQGAGQKRSRPSYPCPECNAPLCSGGNPQILEEKRNLLAQTAHINTTCHELFQLLKQLREYEHEKAREQELGNLTDPNGDSSQGGRRQAAAKGGVGARGGCSSAADLAARVERLKTPLPWDDISLTDQQRLKQQQEKQQMLKEQLELREAAIRASIERENAQKELLEQQRRKERESALRILIFGQPDKQGVKLDANGNIVMAHNKDGPENKFGLNGDPQKRTDKNKLKAQQVLQEDTDNDPNACHVTVQGKKYKVERINETLLDMMTEQEFDKYTELMNQI